MPSVYAAPVRCGLDSGSSADGHGIALSLRALVIPARLISCSRIVNIHRTIGAVVGSVPNRCNRTLRRARRRLG